MFLPIPKKAIIQFNQGRLLDGVAPSVFVQGECLGMPRTQVMLLGGAPGQPGPYTAQPWPAVLLCGVTYCWHDSYTPICMHYSTHNSPAIAPLQHHYSTYTPSLNQLESECQISPCVISPQGRPACVPAPHGRGPGRDKAVYFHLRPGQHKAAYFPHTLCTIAHFMKSL